MRFCKTFGENYSVIVNPHLGALIRALMHGIKLLGGSALLSGGGLLHRHKVQMVPHLDGRQLADDLVQVGRPHALDLVLERRQRVALGRLRRNR